MDKKPDSVVELTQKYKKAAEEITKTVVVNKANTVKGYLNNVKNAVKTAVKVLSKENHNFAYNSLPKGFDEGKKLSATHGGGNTPKKSTAQAKEIMSEMGFTYNRNALNYDTYTELHNAVKSAGDGFVARINKVVSNLAKEKKDTVYNVQQAIIEDLKKRGVLTVKYKNGREVPIEVYAAMAARSARAETKNIGSIGWAEEHGIDYVKMSQVFPTCPICARFQGRVYCISGKDKRFTHLYGKDGPLSHGYSLVHPNCRHSFPPYNLKFHSPEEIDKEAKHSKDLRHFTDEAENAKKYAQWQAMNRQRNDEYKAYEVMKKEYAESNKPLPYTTLGSFRRAARKNPPPDEIVKFKKRNIDRNQFERWKEIIPDDIPEGLDKFQDLKYNKPEEFSSLERFKNTVCDINKKSWTDTFKEKAINTCREFRKDGIEFNVHGVARFLDPKRNFTKQEVYYVAYKDFNYEQPEDGRKIKHYKDVALIYEPQCIEIISVIRRPNESKNWLPIDR